jgi:CHRD domain
MKVILRSVVLVALAAAIANADDKEQKFSARLSGYNEVHFVAGDPTVDPIVPPALRGAVSTKATGSFSAKLNRAGDIIDYVLSYKGLEGNVTQAHIHFGQRSTVGGIVVWLCQTKGNPAPSPVNDPKVTPICPTEGSVKGTITAGQVLAQTAQGINAGDLGELVRALRAEAAYANVHSSLFGPGEVRGQIKFDDKRGDD